MHSYKLTRRGKFVLTTLVVISFLISSFLYVQRSAIASDSIEGKLENTVYLSNVNNNDQSISFSNDLNELKDNLVVNEALIDMEINEEKEAEINDEEEKEINEETETLCIKVEDIRTYDKKIAFLTFDDGPSNIVTPLILETLEKYDVHATFFVLGNMCRKNGYLLNELRDKGHSIGIHSYSHELNELLESKDSFINEIKMTEDIIKENLGEDFTTRLFRFPGGSFETYKQQYITDLHDAGYVSVDWNALTGDSEYKNPKVDVLLERFMATIVNKDRLIILMHDSDTKEVSAAILPDIIEHLRSQGYEFAVLK